MTDEIDDVDDTPLDQCSQCGAYCNPRFELCDECEYEYQTELARNHEAPGMSEH